MLAPLRMDWKVHKFRIGGSLQQTPLFMPPEEFPSELRERPAVRTAPPAV
jgi:hypothetical protein